MKVYIKKLVRLLFFLLAMPVIIIYFILANISNKDATFAGFSQALSLLPGKIGVYYRAAFYSIACRKFSSEVVVGFLTVFSHYDIEVESGVYIGPQCNIGKCKIGKNTLVGSGVHILSGGNQHGTDAGIDIKNQSGYFKKITIGTDCWIGNNATILESVSNRIVIGAGSLCVQRLEKEAGVYFGNPARFYKYR